MAEMKNLCGKIPVELHIKVRQEIEEREISTQQFIQQVIEEHFTKKGGQVSMAVRTLAVQVSEDLFARFKAAVAKKGCKQKDFLIGIIEKAIEEIENEMKPDEAEDEETEAEAGNEIEAGVTEAEAEDGQETGEQLVEPIEAQNNMTEPESDLKESEELESEDTEMAGPEESETEEAEDLELATGDEAETEETA